MPGQPKAPYDVGAALKWAWNTFSHNAAGLILAVLAWGVVSLGLCVAVYQLAFAVARNTPSSPGEPETTLNFGPAAIGMLILSFLVLFVMIGINMSALLDGVLALADGQQVRIGPFFRPRRLGAVIALSVLLPVATLIGFVFFVLPGYAIAFLTIFSTVALIDRSLSIVDAIKFSVDTVRKNVGSVFLMVFIIVVLNVIGQLACLVGLLVSLPLAILMQVYTYRRLTGGTLATLSR